MSNTYVVIRKMFYLDEKDVIKVVAREKTPDGNAVVRTIRRGIEGDIQFPLPYEVLENQRFFVAIHDDLFPDQASPGDSDLKGGNKI